MDWFDQPAGQPDHAPPVAPAQQPVRSGGGGIRRGIATALLAAGLLAVSGVAVVSAADPSASPEATTTQPADGSGGVAPDATSRPQRAAGDKADCPDKGTGGGTGSDGSGGAGRTDASPAPTTDDSTSSPSTDDL